MKWGVLLAALGTGLLLAFFVPPKCLIVLLSALVIILGLLYSRCSC
ncbi:MAG: hypothetical protein J6B93_00400 [Clostridia bacterium]|nr:hypothetical protein [Clostridia bacterium]